MCNGVLTFADIFCIYESNIEQQNGGKMLKLLFDAIQKRTNGTQKLLEVYNSANIKLQRFLPDSNIGEFLKNHVSILC